MKLNDLNSLNAFSLPDSNSIFIKQNSSFLSNHLESIVNRHNESLLITAVPLDSFFILPDSFSVILFYSGILAYGLPNLQLQLDSPLQIKQATPGSVAIFTSPIGFTRPFFITKCDFSTLSTRYIVCSFLGSIDAFSPFIDVDDLGNSSDFDLYDFYSPKMCYLCGSVSVLPVSNLLPLDLKCSVCGSHISIDTGHS